MKKYVYLLVPLLLSSCAIDVGMLGKPNRKYSPQEEENVSVYYNQPIPQNCNQIALGISNMQSTVQTLVDTLRENAAEIGANYVNIDSIGYTSTFLRSSDKHIQATFYLCH